jgi:hypothetical protein
LDQRITNLGIDVPDINASLLVKHNHIMLASRIDRQIAFLFVFVLAQRLDDEMRQTSVGSTDLDVLPLLLIEPRLKISDRPQLDETMLPTALDQLIGLDDSLKVDELGVAAKTHRLILLDPLHSARCFVEIREFTQRNGLGLGDEAQMMQVPVEQLLSRVFAQSLSRHF